MALTPSLILGCGQTTSERGRRYIATVRRRVAGGGLSNHELGERYTGGRNLEERGLGERI
jgi:hypothetical protein